MSREFREFIIAVVIGLKQIRENPTQAKVENLLIDLQAMLASQ
ncbi:hypothetical protein [Petrachloros mirabilis]